MLLCLCECVCWIHPSVCCLHVHICSYLFHLFAACMLCKSFIVVSDVDARLASCVVLVHEWYAFALPYRLVALTPSFCRPFLSTKQTGCWGHKGGPKGHAVWSDDYPSLIVCEMNFKFMCSSSRKYFVCLLVFCNILFKKWRAQYDRGQNVSRFLFCQILLPLFCIFFLNVVHS